MKRRDSVHNLVRAIEPRIAWVTPEVLDET
jgi:hypothetical protein